MDKELMQMAIRQLQVRADNAFTNHIALCRESRCLGEDAKLARGIFGQPELAAHKAAHKMFGRHEGLVEAAKLLQDLLDRGQGPTPKAPEASDQSAESAPCGTRDHWHYINSGEDCLICLEIACERERWKRENPEPESYGGLPPPRPMYGNTD